MKLLFIFPSPVFFVLALQIPAQCAIRTEKLSADIINQTCQECALTMPSNFSYDFCFASLAGIPVSHVTNLAGLGLVSLELALQNATNTVLTINSLLSKNDSSILCTGCLEACLELYSATSAKLDECVGEYISGEHDDVYLWISEIMQATTICEGGFEGEGQQSLLTKENYSLSQLCGMVLCIVDMISPAIKSRSSALTSAMLNQAMNLTASPI